MFADAPARVPRVTTTTALPMLSEPELAALLEASTWYAKYHERMIAELADDPSAMATARLDRFRALHAALRKLGAQVRHPDALVA